MKQNTLNKNQHTSLIKFSDVKAKLILTQEVVNQIKFLCEKISAVEWSGVLYHTSTGDIDNPKEFVCKAEYVLLLDKGTSGYTEYDFSSPDFTSALFEKPELLNFSMSHIHSHNTMNVFFSGTDNEELTDNAPNYNYYLSLIVNNKGEYCARVAFIGEIEGKTIRFKGKDGVLKEIATEKTYCTFYHEMEIVVENYATTDDFFVKQYNSVIERNNAKTATKNNNYGYGFDFEEYNKAVRGDITWEAYYKNLHSPKQTTLDFSKKPKTFVPQTTVDVEALQLLKWILRDGKERGKGLVTLLSQAKLDTPNAIKHNEEYLSERFGKASKYFAEFKKDFKNFDTTVTLEEMWGRMELLLQEEPFSEEPLSKYIVQELNNWEWN